MKKSILTILIVLLTVVFASPIFCAISTPIARINLTKTVVITKEQLDEKMSLYSEQYEGLDRATVLDAMISDVLFEQALERDGFVLDENAKNQLLQSQRATLAQSLGVSSLTDEQFQSVIQTYYGATVEEYKEYLAQQYVLQAYVMQVKQDMFTEDALMPTQAEIDSFYKANKTSLVSSENVKLSHIFFASGEGQEKKVIDVLNQIKSGKITFEKAVGQYSEDTDSIETAGEIGWLAIDDSSTLSYMGQNFFDKVFNLDAGEISDVIESLAGYHIVKVSVHNDAKLLGIDDKINPADSITVRQYITEYLYEAKANTVFQQAYLAIINDLKNEASIRYL